MLVVTAIAHEGLLTALEELRHAGRRVVLFTLAERPPEDGLPGILVYHLPHLVDDIIAPAVVSGGKALDPLPAVEGLRREGVARAAG